MYATEFETVIDKPYVEIPEYENFKGHSVRILILDKTKASRQKNTKESFIEKMIKNPIDFPKDFRFDREEAHER